LETRRFLLESIKKYFIPIRRTLKVFWFNHLEIEFVPLITFTISDWSQVLS